MNDELDSQLNRIRKLLAKAENPAATPAERDSYNDKAATLIARYGIDRAILDDSTGGQQNQVDSRLVDLHPPYAREKLALLWAVASALRCRAVRRHEHSTLRLHLYGMRSDLDRTDLLYTSLLIQASHGLATARPAHPRENITAYRRSWLTGFATAVYQRLHAAEQAAAHQADPHTSDDADPSRRPVSLVLADRHTRVDQALAAAYPQTKPERRRTLSGSGRTAGYVAGQRANLGDGPQPINR